MPRSRSLVVFALALTACASPNGSIQRTTGMDDAATAPDDAALVDAGVDQLSTSDLSGAADLQPGDMAIPLGLLTLRTAMRGSYVSAENGGNDLLSANRPQPGAWEIFTLTDVNGGSLEGGDAIHLVASDGRYVCAENGGGGQVNATRTTASDWETFIVEKVGDSPGKIVRAGDRIRLRTKTLGYYVVAAQGGGSTLDASAASPSMWTELQIGGAGGLASSALPYATTLDQEFDGAVGAVDPAVWTFETGAGGWGNGNLQYYTSRTDNVTVDGNGNLQIIARKESFMGSQYTSARINTSGAFTQAYGRFEARIKMPQGKAIWPAFWTLGSNSGEGWPGRGELDIMEAFSDFTFNHGSAHGPGYSGGQALTAQVKAPTGSFADKYYVYAIEWQPGVVRWYLDGQLYEERTPADLPMGTTWVFDHAFYVILNVAVGSYSLGAPDGTVTWPQTMYVDYVRVYQPS